MLREKFIPQVWSPPPSYRSVEKGMRNSAYQPAASVEVPTCQLPSQLRLKPPPEPPCARPPRPAPPPPPPPPPAPPPPPPAPPPPSPPSSVTCPSYSTPEGVVPNTKPF